MSLVFLVAEAEAWELAGVAPALEDGPKVEDGPCHRKWSGGGPLGSFGPRKWSGGGPMGSFGRWPLAASAAFLEGTGLDGSGGFQLAAVGCRGGPSKCIPVVGVVSAKTAGWRLGGGATVGARAGGGV